MGEVFVRMGTAIFVIVLVSVLSATSASAKKHRRHAMMTDSRYCKSCGLVHPEFARFCRQCGQKL